MELLDWLNKVTNRHTRFLFLQRLKSKVGVYPSMAEVA
jgi:hypothetical protein